MTDFPRLLLDRYHGFKCHNEQLKKLLILEDGACEISWAFRLYTRSSNDAEVAVAPTSSPALITPTLTLATRSVP